MPDAVVQVHKRLRQTDAAPAWSGHVFDGTEGLVQDSAHRPQDLRVTGPPLSPQMQGTLERGAATNPPEEDPGDETPQFTGVQNLNNV